MDGNMHTVILVKRVTNVSRTATATARPAIIAESQPALKFRVNRPRPRSQPARAGRACVLVVYFFSRQLGQL
jgi:hypothetical protein